MPVVTQILAGPPRTVVTEKPDFTGEWTLNCEASALSPAVAAAVESGFVRIEHREPSVAVHLSITMAGKASEFRFERVSDGREVTYPGNAGAGSLRWDGDALIFTDTSHTPNGDVTICFRYELHDAGRRLRATEQLRGGGREQDNVWVFDRAT